MKIYKKTVLLFCILLPMTISAQNKNDGFSLEDLLPGGNSYNKYKIEMPKQMQWWGDKLLYIQGDSIVSVSLSDPQKGQTVFLTKSEINKAYSGEENLIKKLENVSFPFPDKPQIRIKTSNSIVVYDFENKTIQNIDIPKNAGNIEIETNSMRIAYTVGSNELYTLADGKTSEIKTDEKDVSLGQAVHRNEFGINKGMFWSPKGNLLAFYRMDESMVTSYPLVDVSTRIASLKETKYPMAGMKSHQVTIGVTNPVTGTVVYLKTGIPKDKYLTNIAWSPDEKSIYVAEINRGQDTCRLNRYNAISGNLEATLFEEIHPKYVEPENPILFLKNNPQQFIWLSKRDGYNHMYLYNNDGKLLKQLTSGNWDVMSINGFDEKGNHLFYTSTEESPIEQHIYLLNMKNGKHTKLSKEEGVHQVLASASGRYVCDTYNSQFNPGKVVLTDTKQNKTTLIYEAKNPYRNKTLPEITLGKLKANDGATDLYYRLVKPANFDPAKKYPVIVYVYGGPHSQLVTNTWMAQVRGWDIYMAQKGYVVFTLDNRGTSNRGFDFENIIHRQLGVKETEDQMTGVEYLKSLPYIDSDRVGVHGWSYGGFMTLNLMLRHPETFKVGVAGGPVTDWKYYEIMYGERYMDSPKENPDGYAETSMVDKAGQLKGRLMLIHGDEDPTVVIQQSLQFLKSSIKNGTHPDFFIYPGHGHNMSGHDRIHLYEHITRYFEDFLK